MAFIQGNTGSSATTSVAIAFSGNVTAGSILIVAARTVAAGTPSAATIADTQHNAWIKASEALITANNNYVVFYCLRAQSGASTVTLSCGNATGMRAGIGEWAGNGLYNFVDVVGASIGGTGTTSTAPSTIARQTDLAISCAFQATGASVSGTAGGGYTNRVQTSATSYDVNIADQAAAAGTYAGTNVWSLSVTWTAIQIMFFTTQQAGFNAWTPLGTLQPSNISPGRQANPNVIQEANAQILSGTVYKMWCSPANTGGGVYYFESLDGLSDWQPHPSNPIIAAPFVLPQVFKVGSTYYCYVSNVGVTSTTLFTSTDQITWTSQGVVLTVGAGGSWDSTNVAQPTLCDVVNGTWHLYYQGINAGGVEGVGHLTSTDGITLVKDGANPVFTGPSNAYTSFNTFHKVGGTYYCWASMSYPALATGGQTSTFRLSAPSAAGPWTMLKYLGSEINVFYPGIPEDFHVFSNVNSTQIGDFNMIQGGDGHTRLYYTFGDTHGQEYAINCAVAYNTTIAQLVTGYEGTLNTPISGFPQLNLGTSNSDNFTRANANPIGAPWTPLATTGNFVASQLALNFAEPTVAAKGGDSWYTGVWAGDQWSQVTVHACVTTSGVGADVRMNTSSVATAYRMFWSGASGTGNPGSITLQRQLSATGATLLTFTSLVLNVGDTLMIAIVGPKMMLYANGYIRAALVDPNIAAGNPGFLTNAASAVTDSQLSAWSGGTFVAAPTLAGVAGGSGIIGQGLIGDTGSLGVRRFS